MKRSRDCREDEKGFLFELSRNNVLKCSKRLGESGNRYYQRLFEFLDGRVSSRSGIRVPNNAEKRCFCLAVLCRYRQL